MSLNASVCLNFSFYPSASDLGPRLSSFSVKPSSVVASLVSRLLLGLWSQQAFLIIGVGKELLWVLCSCLLQKKDFLPVQHSLKENWTLETCTEKWRAKRFSYSFLPSLLTHSYLIPFSFQWGSFYLRLYFNKYCLTFYVRTGYWITSTWIKLFTWWFK